MIRLFPQLVRDERGASVIEMALVTPVLAAVILGMTDLSRAYTMSVQLQQAAQRAIEKVQQNKTGSTDYVFVGTEAVTAATAAGYSGSTATVNFRLECNGTVKEQTTGAALADTSVCSSGETYARYVSVTVRNKYTPLFGTRYFPGADSSGKVTITGYAGIRVQ
jgi:Flp pilus assembly protein TadG